LVLLVRIVRVLAVVAAGLVALHLVWGAFAGTPRSQPLDWRGARIAEGPGIAMPYPAGWHATTFGGRDIVVASFPVSKQWLDSERKSVPAGGVYIWAFSYGALPRGRAYNSIFEPRPAQLGLDPKTVRFHSCGFNLTGYSLSFADHGRAVQMIVSLGRGADKRAALAVINRLRVA
jgi:hypothetical protein